MMLLYAKKLTERNGVYLTDLVMPLRLRQRDDLPVHSFLKVPLSQNAHHRK